MTAPDRLFALTASEARSQIQSNALTLEQYVASLLGRYKDRDETVRAWAYINPGKVIDAARKLDQIPLADRGRLHGFVIGVKDIINTQDSPTRHNCPYHAGDSPQIDASTVAILRANGALIMGKTATTEFAATTTTPGTKNPHDANRSPGGSSSGSAAGVADMQFPIGLGTQTIGSIVRPASFNGIYGLKPTWNAISTEGQKKSAPTLDTFGFLTRSIDDLQALADVFVLKDDEAPVPVSLQGSKFAMVKTSVWPKAGPGTISAMEETARILRAAGATVEELTLPPEFDDLPAHQACIMQAEASVAFLKESSTSPAKISDDIAKMGQQIHSYSKKEFINAIDTVASLRPKIDDIANQYTAIIAPSAVDVAPVGAEWTGDSSFNGVWTALHVPLLNIPAFAGESNMPVGVSLVTARYRDQHLLQVGRTVAPLLVAQGGWESKL